MLDTTEAGAAGRRLERSRLAHHGLPPSRATKP